MVDIGSIGAGLLGLQKGAQQFGRNVNQLELLRQKERALKIEEQNQLINTTTNIMNKAFNLMNIKDNPALRQTGYKMFKDALRNPQVSSYLKVDVNALPERLPEGKHIDDFVKAMDKAMKLYNKGVITLPELKDNFTQLGAKALSLDEASSGFLAKTRKEYLDQAREAEKKKKLDTAFTHLAALQGASEGQVTDVDTGQVVDRYTVLRELIDAGLKPSEARDAINMQAQSVAGQKPTDEFKKAINQFKSLISLVKTPAADAFRNLIMIKQSSNQDINADDFNNFISESPNIYDDIENFVSTHKRFKPLWQKLQKVLFEVSPIATENQPANDYIDRALGR